ncbi:hypothetical protein LZ30DRAFT_737330 [Colletotrichum cereale]|nr:hypothetical protein LZ30DRAFT_737330 [Colletotrichum cereale]
MHFGSAHGAGVFFSFLSTFCSLMGPTWRVDLMLFQQVPSCKAISKYPVPGLVCTPGPRNGKYVQHNQLFSYRQTRSPGRVHYLIFSGVWGVEVACISSSLQVGALGM